MLQEPTPEAPLAFGRYQLIRRIGAGGMGEVFLAREGGSAPRAVVVKKVLPNLVANRAFVGRFLDEAKVVVRLSHKNIARVYAMGDVDGEYFLSMEYVQGKTVSRFMKRLRDRKQELPLGMVLLLGERVCEGLQYAHDAKDENGNPLHLVHRDLSPANVCMSYGGEVKIIDFGAAQSTLKEEQTAPRVVIGNLTYMAPEQAKKQIVDGRADIYSCGVMLWELLSWHALPQKGDPIERWRKAANPVWDAPSSSQPSIPRDVDDVILKALRKEPKDRFPTATEFGQALKLLRSKYTPEVKDSDLGALLAQAFGKEKSVEDAVLHEAIYGHVPKQPHSREVPVVPPTALAFEHTSVLASSDLILEDAGEAKVPVEDDTAPPLKAAAQSMTLSPPTHSRRTIFGVTLPEVQEAEVSSLIQEIDASEDFVDPMFQVQRRSVFQKTVLFGGVFVSATAFGFGLIWLLTR
jgi:serine/threonine protein kinase